MYLLFQPSSAATVEPKPKDRAWAFRARTWSAEPRLVVLVLEPSHLSPSTWSPLIRPNDYERQRRDPTRRASDVLRLLHLPIVSAVLTPSYTCNLSADLDAIFDDEFDERVSALP